MNKVHLLGANRSYDRDVQTVSVNQVVVLEGYSYDSYVVYEVTRDKWGITYHLVNLETHEFHTSDLIRPLSEKFGIGIYYDDANPKFLDPLETAALLTKAKEKKAEAERKVKEAREEYERIAKIGAERLRPLIPTDAKAAIIGTLRVSECDSYTDYYDYSIVRTVILGFSKHTRNLFSEMRKHAANSHAKLGWSTLTDYIIERCCQLPQPVVFLAWGRFAQQMVEGKLDAIGAGKATGKFCLASTHPSPLSANRATAELPAFIGSRPFSAANRLLEQHGSTPVNWTCLG